MGVGDSKSLSVVFKLERLRTQLLMVYNYFIPIVVPEKSLGGWLKYADAEVRRCTAKMHWRGYIVGILRYCCRAAA